MQHLSHVSAAVPVEVQRAAFSDAGGVHEHHLILRPLACGDIATQLQWLRQAYADALAAAGPGPDTTIVRRFFCSDLANQTAALAACPLAQRKGQAEPCAVSWVGMPPQPPARVVLWAYHVSDAAGTLRRRREGEALVWQHGAVEHHWMTGLRSSGATAYEQTRAALAHYDEMLRMQRMSWLHNVLRTWLFVRDIDTHYSGVVAARREFFAEQGLTPQTHFVASTGIEGRAADPATLLTLDAYAVRGIRPEQITYLRAPEYLGPTHVYGVTFERGVAIDYGDRRHIMISGTASIDPAGQVVHAGDVARQVERTLTIVAALLKAAGAGFGDLATLVAYVRDPADLVSVTERVRGLCGSVPVAVLAAPICRPGWLVEMEAAAIVPVGCPGLPAL